jgi:hypothetical protein
MSNSKWFVRVWALTILIGIVAYCWLLISLSNRQMPTQTIRHDIQHAWTKQDSLAYAHDQVYADAEKQFTCLSNLWGKESAWNPKAHNPIRVMGKTAGGIPQLLGLSPLTPPTAQIDRGLAYIVYRYNTPCGAWTWWRGHGWY